jgi:hypothetical protein
MPRIEFTEKNVKKNPYDFPKLKLEKKGDFARAVLLESPVGEYVHDLRAPKLVNGVATKETKQRADGSSYTDYVMEFISRPICLGDWDTLEERGSDPKNCPICQLAKETDFASAPKRRFALHVFQYNTKANKADISLPFGGQVKVWSFTDKVFTKVFDLGNQWGDLRQKDLILKCDNPFFQNYELSIAAKTEWLDDADQARRQYVKQTFEENKAEDLSLFCGSKKDKKWIEEDVTRIKNVWAQVLGAPVSAGPDAIAASASLSEGLDNLLGSNVPKTGATESFDSILGTPATPAGGNVVQDQWLNTDAAAALEAKETETITANTTAAPAPTAVATEPPAPGADSFDDILAGL